MKRMVIVGYYVLRDSKVVDDIQSNEVHNILFDIHSDEVHNILFPHFLESNRFGPF